jgi:hypothetical protein
LFIVLIYLIPKSYGNVKPERADWSQGWVQQVVDQARLPGQTFAQQAVTDQESDLESSWV